jgi:hypothetical protein
VNRLLRNEKLKMQGFNPPEADEPLQLKYQKERHETKEGSL